MQHRPIDKRFHAEAFLEIADDETHCCNYLLATDLEMATLDGYASTSWERGYGGYVVKPDPPTLRLDGAMFNSGQCCCGIERIYVHENRFDAFVEQAVATVMGYCLGNPLNPETTLGPMAHVRFSAEVRAQVAEAVAAGATAHIDTMSLDDGGTYLSPQVLTGVNHDMRVMREESFGPVVGIMPVRNDDEAIRLMNDSDFGLTASLWTQDLDRAVRLGDRIETGTVFLNRADYLDPGLCWTGCKQTGRGGALSVIGYYNLTRPKSYHLKKVTQ